MTQPTKQENQLNLTELIGLVIGSIIGGGIFNLNHDVAQHAAPGAAIIAWVITGIGMLALAMCFQNLVNQRPDLDAGIYSYAKAGFGDYVGFNAAWGYWMSSWIGNTGFASLLMSALGYFFPIFGNGHNFASILGASVILWLGSWVVAQGVKSASFINVILTVVKMIPLFIFIVIIILAFKLNLFTANFWGTFSHQFDFAQVTTQVKNTMLVCVWVFVGVEGAVLLSGRAKNRKDVGRATVWGILAIIMLYMLVSVVSYSVMTQSQLAHLKQPALASLLEQVVGHWGAVVIDLGLVISILGAWLSWTLFTAEVPYEAAKHDSFPKIFMKTNRHGTPIVSLITTSVCMNLFFFVFVISANAYQFIYSLATAIVLIPYLLSALYQIKLTAISSDQTSHRGFNLTIGVIASLYLLWVLYASGLKYLLLTVLIFGPGTLVYIYLQRHDLHRHKIFSRPELLLAITILGLFAYTIFALVTGQLKVD